MNTYIIEIEYTDGYTYNYIETNVIKSLDDITTVFCKITDSIEKYGYFKTRGLSLSKDYHFEIFELEDWIKRSESYV